MRTAGARRQTVWLALTLVAAAALAADGRERLDAEIATTVGIAFLNNQEYEEALDRFQSAARLDPEDGTARFLAGTALSRLGRYEEALAALAEAGRLRARVPPGQIDWFSGTCHYELSEYDKAERAFRAALGADPDDAQAHFYLGLTLIHLGRAEEANPHFERAEQLDPALASSASFFQGKSFYEAGDLHGAEAAFVRTLHSTATSENARRAATNYISGIDDLAVPGPPRWELSFGFGAEADDNVLVSPDDPSLGTTSEADRRGVLTLKADYYPFYDLDGWSLGLTLLAYQSVHQDRSDLNLTAPQGMVSVSWGKDPRGWVNGPIAFTWVPTGTTPVVFTAQVASTYDWLDGSSYLRSREVGINVKVPEASWTATQVDLDYRSNTFFQSVARSGDFAQVRVLQHFYLGRRERQLRLGLRAARNEADGSTIDLSHASGEFCSVNPGPACIDAPTEADLVQDGGASADYRYDEREIWIDAAIPLPGRVSLFAQASYQEQDYDNVSSNPQLRGADPGQLRQDDRLTLSLSVAWGITPHWNLVGRYAYFDNDSNKEWFRYTRGVASIGVNWYF